MPDTKPRNLPSDSSKVNTVPPTTQKAIKIPVIQKKKEDSVQ